jgi:hypothetical protein
MTRQVHIIVLTFGVALLASCDNPGDTTPPKQGANHSARRQQAALLSDIGKRFRKSNPKVDEITLVDIAKKHVDADVYVVLARGIRADKLFEGSFSDELFGLFLVDRSFTGVITVLDILPTKRWNDYTMRIEYEPVADVIVLIGEGETYGDSKFRKEYPFPEVRPK